MNRASLAIAALIGIVLLNLSASSAQPEGVEFDAIVVRGDIYADWTIAMAYGIYRGIPVITLIPGLNDEEVLSMVSGLTSFKETPRVMFVGDKRAVPEEFRMKLESQGISVSRFGGPTRFDTALYVLTQLWSDAETMVVVDGTRPELYFPALLWSRELAAPIVYAQNGSLPDSFWASAGTYLTNLKQVVVIGDSLSNSEIARLSVMYEVIAATPAQPPTSWPSSNPVDALKDALLHPALFVGAAAGCGIAYAILRRREERGIEAFVDQFLTADERAIFSAIMEKGKITQDKLPEITGFSKPKISRLVAELVDRGLITRERVGKTYILYPAKIFKARPSEAQVGEG